MTVTRLHPERCPAEPLALRWVTDSGLLPLGVVRSAPGALGALLRDGSITRAVAEDGAVWLWSPEDWRSLGPRVRTALLDSLCEPGWVIDPAPDEVLSLVATDVVRGPLADYITSHGGSIDVVGATDGELRLTLRGACDGCPAAGATLQHRIAEAVRERFPGLRQVVA